MRENDLIEGVMPINPLDVLDATLTARREGALVLQTWTDLTDPRAPVAPRGGERTPRPRSLPVTGGDKRWEALPTWAARTGWGRATAARPPTSRAFAEPWEGRAFAMTVLTMGGSPGRNLDAFRHALGRLPRADYLDDGYYGRWLNAAELMLTDSAILAGRGRRPRPGSPAVSTSGSHRPGADAKPTTSRPPAGSMRPVDEPPKFAVGDRVRTKDSSPAGPHPAGRVRARHDPDASR